MAVTETVPARVLVAPVGFPLWSLATISITVVTAALCFAMRTLCPLASPPAPSCQFPFS